MYLSGVGCFLADTQDVNLKKGECSSEMQLRNAAAKCSYEKSIMTSPTQSGLTPGVLTDMLKESTMELTAMIYQ